MLSVFLAVITLVPAPREFKAAEGVCRQEIVLPCPKYDWWDFDVRGACLDAMKVTRTRDVSLRPEGYRLKVEPDGVEIAAADEAGAFYARKTLEQLAEQIVSNAVALACCEIVDSPAYRWRGMLLDEARFFLGKTVVMRVLDLMAMHKMNVLHWHLTDDQGWRIELKRHPELTRYGAVRPSSVKYGTHMRWLPPDKVQSCELDGETHGPFYYRVDEIREIREYAKARHVKIVPEIELPGHCRALLAAHPELSCTGTVPREPCCCPAINKDVICVGNDAAIRLYEEILDEVCEHFPDSPYIHIGGDECPRERWKACEKCQGRIKSGGLKDENGLQAWICSHMVRYLEKKGRRAVGWDEALAGDVPASTIGMSWRMTQKGGAGNRFVSAADAAMCGHDMVMTPRDFCYLDYPQFAEGDPYVYHSPWSAPLTLEKTYSFDPVAGIPESVRLHIIGGQANVWGEQIRTVFDLEWKTWPRACAIAEVLWCGDRKPGYADFLRRMKVHRERLIRQHVNCAPLKEYGERMSWAGTAGAKKGF